MRSEVDRLIKDKPFVSTEEDKTDDKKDTQELFADLIEMIAMNKFVQFTGGGFQYDDIATCIKLYYTAWQTTKQLQDDHEVQVKKFHKVKGCLYSNRFNSLDGLREMLKGNYIVENWKENNDHSDAYNDVISLNQNVGLIAALILTIAIPLVITPDIEITDESTNAEILYIFFVSVSAIIEGVTVLITTRNLIALNALDLTNIKEYLMVAADTLMVPVRLNFIAVCALFAALNLWAYIQSGFISKLYYIPHSQSIHTQFATILFQLTTFSFNFRLFPHPVTY